MRQQCFIYGVILRITCTLVANEPYYTPYQELSQTCMQHTAEHVVTQIAHTAGKHSPTIAWSTADEYPYPDYDTHQVVLPNTTFTYHAVLRL